MPKLRAPSKAGSSLRQSPHLGSTASRERGDGNGRPQQIHTGPSHGSKVVQQARQTRPRASRVSSPWQREHSVGKATARTASSKFRRMDGGRESVSCLGEKANLTRRKPEVD